MKKILFESMLFITLNVSGQNLVPNPNFEQYTICPTNWFQISNCIFWDSNRETPDYLHTCSSSNNISPPNCFYGFQYPHSGNAYVGFISYSTFGSYTNYREMIGANLLLSLVTNQKYFISFYVNLGGQNQATIASNKIGIKFSTVQYSYSNPAPINNFAHFYTDSIITDTAKWTKISGSFIADSAYSYIIIGNFFVDSLTDTILLSPGNTAYYYIDDVCVSTDSLYCENWVDVKEQITNKEEITIYPNPCINELNVKYYNMLNEQSTLIIIDIFGRIVMQVKTKENEFTFNTGKLAKGLYLVKVETANKVVLQKVMKE
ncbi:MAG: hypothetical protein A2X08_00045 [Bacteroidetes bacterium GWA2_32_17]|nr:MAG: hypothetical protein A2X08_00045 [Bacteroidetes bacterium GWA2_32_17]